ncbi:MAG: methyltransferase domain-containing protein, partial [Synechococcales cyanobacterium H12SWP_bin.12]|nr:methyltransferase domain-containing protein [Synechococcales cyanobacterium H12SWP_bin.12]
LPIAATGISVVGLEINPASVQQAQQNAASNGITDASFEAGDVALLLSDYLPDHDALVVDPPRKGLAPVVLDAILNCPPKSMAYLSCDSATLARDLKRLVSEDGPYAIDRIQPVDFFPQTTHLECLVLMKRINCEVQP